MLFGWNLQGAGPCCEPLAVGLRIWRILGYSGSRCGVYCTRTSIPSSELGGHRRVLAKSGVDADICRDLVTPHGTLDMAERDKTLPHRLEARLAPDPYGVCGRCFLDGGGRSRECSERPQPLWPSSGAGVAVESAKHGFSPRFLSRCPGPAWQAHSVTAAAPEFPE